jgi:hypothetical protein
VVVPGPIMAETTSIPVMKKLDAKEPSSLSAECEKSPDENRLTCDFVQVLEVTPLVAASLAYDRPRTVRQAQFSMPFAVACALVWWRPSARAARHCPERSCRPANSWGG